ncbi:MAG: aminotransferase class V-fold PLP-dependent enzyme [Bdellovibrionia bacterium]
MSLDSFFAELRKEFPTLDQKIRGKSLAYLDSAATTLKPKVVIDRVHKYYSFETSNVHRGAHFLSDQGTVFFEGARSRVASFLGVQDASQIIFTRGTTESINLVASTWGRSELTTGDKILLTEMEHHANIVPWQMLAAEKGFEIHWVNVLENGEIDFDDFIAKLELNPKLVSFTACSNTLGSVNPFLKMATLAKAKGAVTLIDAAQVVSIRKLNLDGSPIDFLALSGHKLFAPTGIGVLFGKRALLEKMPPYQGGGSMISKVDFSGVSFNDLPFKFEAGTPHVEGAVGLATAIDFFEDIGFERVHQWESQLMSLVTTELNKIPDLQFYGQASEKAPIVSFVLKGVHPSDVGQLLDQQGVAVRVGHHCTQPLMHKFGIPGTVRASFSIYNNEEDIHQFVRALVKAREILL